MAPVRDNSGLLPQRTWRCPTDQDLAQYIDGSLNAKATAAVQNHVSNCAYCLNVTASSIASARLPSTATPAYLEIHAKSLPKQGGRTWQWEWALGPVFACLVAAALLLRLPLKPASARRVPVSTGNSSPAQSLPAGATPSTSLNPVRSLGHSSGSLSMIAPASGSVLNAEGLHLEWTAVSNVAYYQVRVTTADGELIWQTHSLSTSVQLPKTLKLTETKYFVWVTAYLNDGRTLRSDAVEFRVQFAR